MTVKDLRTAAGLTQQALAARFGIPLRTVEDWDAGRRNPPPYVLRMMAELLGIPV